MSPTQNYLITVQRMKITEIKALARWSPTSPHATWKTITAAVMKRLPPGTTLAITRGPSTLYTCYRPPRRRDESPVEYYKRTKVVDDNFTRGHKGRYYCNPAHCSRSWASRKERDAHLAQGYGILD